MSVSSTSTTSSPPSPPTHREEYEARLRRLREASRLSLAPMMEYTDRHFRHLVRLVSRRTLVYTEMVAANAVAHERRDALRAVQEQWRDGESREPEPSGNDHYSDQFLRRYLSQAQVSPGEGACVLQLGGSSPEQLFEAVQAVMDMTDHRQYCNYTAINLNCGCPSPKVAGKGCFGASLMDDPALVAVLTRAMYDGGAGRMPVTVKCRIGTDTHAPYSQQAYAALDPETEYRQLCRFIETVARDGVVTDFQVHARIAVLSKSFSPADNRKVPPLKYDYVRRLVTDYPELTFSLNGGISSLTQARAELERAPGLAGVMVGRAWAAQPWDFAMTDTLLYDDDESSAALPRNRLEVLQAYGRHADFEESIWDPVKIRRFILKAVTRLFAGEANAKQYRIALDKIAASAKELQSKGLDIKSQQPPLSELILGAAMEHLSEEALLRSPEESFERLLDQERRHSSSNAQLISEWQDERKAIEQVE